MMMSTPYIQTILSAFAELDIEKLRFYLNDEYSYQDTTKEIFLEKIEKLFKEHKHLKDNELLLFRGECGRDECENCGKGGYRFVGNHSKNYLDLLFIEEEGDVKDIFHCESFKPIQETGELNSSDFYFINRDEEIDFEKTPEYYAKANAAVEAFEEIVTTPIASLSFEEIEYWLKKHAFTYDRIGGYDVFIGSMRWTEFAELYSSLDALLKYSEAYNEKIISTNAAYSQIDGERDLVHWLTQHETLVDKATFEIRYSHFYKLNRSENESIPYIRITDVQFESICAFFEKIDEHYFKMLEKYSTYTDDEISDIFNDAKYQQDTEHVLKLSFHIEKRKEAEELGFTIPFFLKDTEDSTE